MNEWDHAHAELSSTLDYGGPHSYVEIAKFVEDCYEIEDWGCGGGRMRDYLLPHPAHAYTGIDGSLTPYGKLADLTRYRSECDAVILRHVLEHNYDWQLILDNAFASARRKVAVVLFTPLQHETHNLWSVKDYGDVPNIGFNVYDLLAHMPWNVKQKHFTSPNTYFGEETCLFASR